MCTYTCLWTVLQVDFSCASKAELSSFVSTRSNPVSLGLPLYRWSSAELNGRVFHDVNAIILMFNCELRGTIAGEDLAHLEEQNGTCFCHGISSGYGASARQSRNLKKGPVPEAVYRDVSQQDHEILVFPPCFSR